MLATALNTNLLLAFRNIGAPEIIVIALVVLLLFGGKKLPELARGLARGLKGFKDEMRGITSEVEDIKKSVTDEPAEKESSDEQTDGQDEKPTSDSTEQA